MKFPKELPINRVGLRDVKTVGEVVVWLNDLVKVLDEHYALLKNEFENGGLKTENWRRIQATATDVTAGYASTVGDLILQHSNDGITWTTVDTAKSS